MISNKYNFVYLHVPKTGGTSIWKSLEPIVEDLNYVGHGNDWLVPYNKSHFVFTSIRNPWDITVSNYFYLRKDRTFWNSSDGSTKYPLRPGHQLAKSMTFKEFVLHLGEEGLDDIHLQPQYKWIEKFNIDYFIRFENFEENIYTLCDKLHLPRVKVLKLNSTARGPYYEYYDKETIEVIRKKYQKDIERFGYEFKV